MFLLPLMLLPIALVALAVGAMSKRDAERTAVWARWAMARNWLFHPQWPFMVDRFSDVIFGRGSSRVADRGFEGQFDGVPVFGFRYRYTVSSGKSSTTYVYFVAGIRFPGANFPPFRLSREGFLSGRDVQFESDAFNETWNVYSPSPRFAHDLIHPRAMAFLMGPVPPFNALWFEGDCMLACISGDPDPLRVDAHLRLVTQFADLIPNFTLRELGSWAPEVDQSGPGVSLEEQQRRMQELARFEHAQPTMHAPHASAPHPSALHPSTPHQPAPQGWPGVGPWRR